MDIRIYRIPFDSPGEEIPPPAVVGSKAHNLMRIAAKAAVPPGFVIPVDFCRQYNTMSSNERTELDQLIQEEVEWLGRSMGKEFNGKRFPLLVSVRSGAPISMPGMMETVLNIGLNEETVRGLIRQTGNPRFAWDSYRRFVQQYGEVVFDLSPQLFEKIYETHTRTDARPSSLEPDTETLRKITREFQQIYANSTNQSFPKSPNEQLHSAITAVIRSWNSCRALAYRKINSIPETMCTAVIVQAMVFGNSGRRSGSGVGFTRNPANGNKEPYFDYLANAQGEDVVSGRRTVVNSEAIASQMPEIYSQLLQSCELLEAEFNDMQDFEFTVEQGKLFLLQSRSGKRTPPAALKIATDLVEEGVISPSKALQMLSGYQPEEFSTSILASSNGDEPIARATSGGSGVVAGKAIFDSNRIDNYLHNNEPVIYLCRTLSTDDIEIMTKVCGLVTILGARTSHAAVVARQVGKVCIVGCDSLKIDDTLQFCYFADTRVEEGDWLSLDGDSGHIFPGQVKQITRHPTELLDKVATWKNIP